MNASDLRLAYAASVLGGQLLLFPAMELVHWALGKPKERIWWVAFLVGMTERAIVTTLVIGAPSTVVLFISGWTAAKIASGWGRFTGNTPEIRASNMMSLVGFALSYAVAIAAGLWAHPSSLTVFAIAAKGT